ncbi:TPA: hypothetical protein ROX86_001857 [Bacillus thuringiensis]|nr:hypothetical protein [Bacillus thuringiensis]
MKEVEFRAWDLKDKRMYHNVGIVGTLIILEHEQGGYEFCELELKSYDHIDNNYELMQYTGLKDKNGKKLFEGDVIKVPSINDHVHGNYSYKEIIYRNGTWIAQYIKSEKGQVVPKGYMAGHLIDCYDYDYKALVFYDDRLEHTDIEVVGNIYENSTK